MGYSDQAAWSVHLGSYLCLSSLHLSVRGFCIVCAGRYLVLHLRLWSLCVATACLWASAAPSVGPASVGPTSSRSKSWAGMGGCMDGGVDACERVEGAALSWRTLNATVI